MIVLDDMGSKSLLDHKQVKIRNQKYNSDIYEKYNNF